MNKRDDGAAAQACYARAFALEPNDSRLLFELDQLHKKLGEAPAVRLARLAETSAPGGRSRRPDCGVCHAAQPGRTARRRAGGAAGAHFPSLGRRRRQGVRRSTWLRWSSWRKAALARGDAATAIDYLERARTYPDNLAEGKLAGAPENQIDYWLGRGVCAEGDPVRARPPAIAVRRRVSWNSAPPCTTTTARRKWSTTRRWRMPPWATQHNPPPSARRSSTTARRTATTRCRWTTLPYRCPISWSSRMT
jgi:hypothetical protein